MHNYPESEHPQIAFGEAKLMMLDEIGAVAHSMGTWRIRTESFHIMVYCLSESGILTMKFWMKDSQDFGVRYDFMRAFHPVGKTLY